MVKRHHGIKIVPVKVTRYEVRDVMNRRVRSFATAAAAKAWAAGYVKAYDQFAGEPAARSKPESAEATAARSRAHPLHPDNRDDD